MSLEARGGVEGMVPEFSKPAREIFLTATKSEKSRCGIG